VFYVLEVIGGEIDDLWPRVRNSGALIFWSLVNIPANIGRYSALCLTFDSRDSSLRGSCHRFLLYSHAMAGKSRQPYRLLRDREL